MSGTLCQLPGCAKPVPPGQRKYCCPQHCRKMNRQTYQALHKADYRKRALRCPDGQGLRTCLSCDREFLSTSPGNRVCPQCTELNADFTGRVIPVHAHDARPYMGAPSDPAELQEFASCTL